MSKNIFLRLTLMLICDMILELKKCRRGGMADAPVLGTGVSDVQVQVLSPAPKNQGMLLHPLIFSMSDERT